MVEQVDRNVFLLEDIFYLKFAVVDGDFSYFSNLYLPSHLGTSVFDKKNAIYPKIEIYLSLLTKWTIISIYLKPQPIKKILYYFQLRLA